MTPARLTADAILACRIASSSKRTLSSQDAKALTMLRRKLPKDASDSRWTAEMARRPPGPFPPNALTAADEAIMHCAELLLLVGGRGTLSFAHLQALDHVPESLRQLPALLDWFSAFGGTSAQRPLFTSLDVSHTPLKGASLGQTVCSRVFTADTHLLPCTGPLSRTALMAARYPARPDVPRPACDTCGYFALHSPALPQDADSTRSRSDHDYERPAAG